MNGRRRDSLRTSINALISSQSAGIRRLSTRVILRDARERATAQRMVDMDNPRGFCRAALYSERIRAPIALVNGIALDGGRLTGQERIASTELVPSASPGILCFPEHVVVVLS